MRTIRLVVSAGLFITPAATAQPGMYAIDASGGVHRIDLMTGAATLIGHSGFSSFNAAAADSSGRIFTDNGPDQLILINPTTGVGAPFLTLTGRPIGFGIRGIAFGPGDRLFVALSQASTSAIDLLATIDLNTGAYTTVGPTGRTDIQGLAASPTGVLYALGAGGNLYTLDPMTGAATVIGGAPNPDTQTLEFGPGGVLYAARTDLRIIDPMTGLSTVIGPTGVGDIRGLAFVRPAACYANCDGSTAPPILNVNDFICFQAQFAAGESYANCDQSTSPPVLNVNDFICFQSAFAAGCP